MRRYVACGVLLALTACVAPPRHEVRTRFAHVRADDEATARLTAAEVDAALPRLRALLAPEQDTPVELWVQDGLPFFPEPWREEVLGYALPDEQRAFVERPGGDLDAWRSVLFHELTHLVIDASLRPALEFVLEEALCEVLALELLSDARTRARIRAEWWLGALKGLSRQGEINVALSVLVDHASESRISWLLTATRYDCDRECAEVPIDELPVLTTEPSSHLVNAASRSFASLALWRVVRLHGWDDALRLLEQRAGSDALDAWRARWLAHAGLGPDPSSWLDPLLADQDRELLARLFLERPGPPPEAFDHAATMLASVFVADRRRWPADDLAAWMRRRQPRLAVRSPWFTGDVSTPLAGEPEFLAALERAWADPPEGVAPIELGSVFELVKKAASAP